MDTSYKQEVTVGALVILAIVLFIVGSTWLRGQSIGGDKEDFWKVQFRSASNLKASSPVRVSGVMVGKVQHIELLDVGKVLVYVSLNERIAPRVDASAQVVAIGLGCPGTGSSWGARRPGSPTSRRSSAIEPTACSFWRRS
jgi:ABC-type transporter Mla subunit MlaD